MTKKISVIVPVYNSKRYLAECLNSLVNQTIPQEDLEILVIDDCSTDGSRELAEQYARRFSQICVLATEQNSGAGGARNVGLQAAEGKYLGFVDSDDAVVPTMYEHLYDTAVAGDYDMVDAGIYYQKNDSAIVHTADEDTGDQNDEKRSHNIVSGGYLVSRIFRRSMWDTLRFREHAILEDMEPLMYLNATAKRIGNLKEICYIYRYTEGSASEEARFEHYHKQVLAAMEACYEKLHVLPCYDGIREAVEYAILQLYAYALVNCLQQKGKIEDEQILQMQEQLRELRLRCVTGNCQNQYVQKKIDATSQRFMELNDADPRALLREVRSFI